MIDRLEQQNDAGVAAYDDEAEACGWFGPEIAFGLSYPFVLPGQSILDIGIGTGLGAVLFRKAGLQVYGLDNSLGMLDVSRLKGFTNLKLHDLCLLPYPYESESMDHVVCTGVLNFFSDLSPVFKEAVRILRDEGLFVFVVCDRDEHDAHEVRAGSEQLASESSVMMYRHSSKQIDTWLAEHKFLLLRSLPFLAFTDRQHIRCVPFKAYLARKNTHST